MTAVMPGCAFARIFRGGLFVGSVLAVVAAVSAAPAPFTNSLGMEFRPVPGTTVLFSLWVTRVCDFATFVADTGYDATAGVFSIGQKNWEQVGASWKNPGYPQTDLHPAGGLSWFDAQAFCVWLTQREQAAGRIAGTQRYRLPTDAEWDAAVGLTPANREEFPWGKAWPPPARAGNYAGREARDAQWPAAWTTVQGYDDGFARTSPVGSFAPNRFGLFDLSGNVWQWGEDRFDAKSDKRVVRGGSFRVDAPEILQLGRRGDGAPDSRYVHRGFRCVLTSTTR